MKKTKLELVPFLSRQRCLHLMIGFAVLYLILMSFEIPLIFRSGAGMASLSGALPRPSILQSEEDLAKMESPIRPRKEPFRVPQSSLPPSQLVVREFKVTVSGLIFAETGRNGSDRNLGFSELQNSARDAWEVGRRLWEETRSESNAETDRFDTKKKESKMESCPNSIALTGEEFLNREKIMLLPCGLTLGSHITVVGKPHAAHKESDPKISALKEGEDSVMVSQFMMELQGLKFVDGEDPPRILHFNPRLKGDWSGKPVIEQNTCYRMQWGTALRCDGWRSRVDEETGM